MTINLKVGDTISWLDNKPNHKPRIKTSVIKHIDFVGARGTWQYTLEDNSAVTISYDVVAKEDLIQLLYPTKVGSFNYNQLVYVIGESNSNLSITKAYVKSITGVSEYLLNVNKNKDDNGFIRGIVDIYSSLDEAENVIPNWLSNNDNI